MKNIQHLMHEVEEARELSHRLANLVQDPELSIARQGYCGANVPKKYDGPLRDALKTIVSNIHADIAGKAEFLTSMEKLAEAAANND